MSVKIGIAVFCSICSMTLALADDDVFAGPGYDMAKALFSGKTLQESLPKEIQERVNIRGVVLSSFGIDSDGNIIWRRANADFNERNWRILSGEQLNHFENTYDPRLFSRLQVKMDAVITKSVSMYMNVTVDPWSFTGKTPEMTVTGLWGDTVTVQHLYTAATGYTVNRLYNTQKLGDGIAMPELKTDGNRVPAVTVGSAFGDSFNIPASKLEMTFNPLRELWFDIKPGDKGTIRIFPMAYDNQALSTDDPLKLSNNKTYWEESPWLRSWTRGILNTGGFPDFTKGKWDRSLANATRDSDGQHLTALRGVALDMKPNEDASLKATVATPKTLWQDYDEVTAVPGSVRFKQFLGDRLFFGTTEDMHLGLISGRLDATNYVESLDTGFEPVNGVKVTAQAAHSNSDYDRTTPFYETRFEGNAYQMAVEVNSSPEDMLNKDYFAQRAPQGTATFAKSRLVYAQMDDTFDASLSNYHETRDDSYWSRHLTFYPSPYRRLPGTAPVQTEYDLESFAIGTGLDIDRKVLGWRGDVSALEGRVRGLGDVRYVTTMGGEYVETVSRTQWAYDVTDRLTTKALLLNQKMPKTSKAQDPYIVDGNTGKSLINNAIAGGDDPSLNTVTAGARYQVTDKVAVNGVWEHTNDKTAGTDNFPQGVLNSGSFATYTENGRVYRRDEPFLYSQQYFDQPPYDYFNIFKAGVEIKPADAWTVYLDCAVNPNKFAGNIDDNSNHVGIEMAYVPNYKWGFFGRYTYSKWIDLATLATTGEQDYKGYNNFFLETRYFMTKDSHVAMEYGVGPAYNTGVSSTNPTVAYYTAPVLDVQHIVRMSYEKKF